MQDTRIAALVVQHRSPRLHRFFGVENGRKNLVLDFETAATFFGGGFSFGDDGDETLADETRDVVEHVRIVGVDAIVFVNRRRIEPARNVLPGKYRNDAGNGQRFGAVDRKDFRVRVRRAQHLEVQQAIHRRDVAGVARVSGDDVARERIGHARAA